MLYQLYFLIFIGTPTITVSGQKSLTTFITGGVGGAGAGSPTHKIGTFFKSPWALGTNYAN